jgi:hypothetical protein
VNKEGSKRAKTVGPGMKKTRFTKSSVDFTKNEEKKFINHDLEEGMI